MKSLARFISVVLLSLWLLGAYAADAVQPGEYVLSGDWGRLKVEGRDGKTNFSIVSVSANCHTCDLSGQIIGYSAETVDEGLTNEEMVCRIRMTPSPDGRQVKVEPQTFEACRQYCGMRAAFDGIYLKPKVLCTDKGQRSARNRFIQHYRAKQFSQAVETLRPILEQCGEFLNWIEIDDVRNDLSLAYFHAGKSRQCIDTLQKTRASSFVNEEALRQGLPPCDFDNYVPTAKATWHNLRLCGSEPAVKR